MANIFNSLFGKKKEQQIPNVFQPQQQQQQQQQAPMSSNITLIPVPDKEKDKKLSSVIITICCGSSYDPLFTSQPQEAPDGKVHVYAVENLKILLNVLKGNPSTDIEKRLAEEIATKDVDTVINFECCSCFCDQGFGPDTRVAHEIIQIALAKSLLLMFSDFSLKALIGSWDSQILGPKAFTKIGEFSDQFILRFVPGLLKECVSSQLQTVGALCEKGEAFVHALGGTIAYTVTKEAYSTTAYKLEILTVQESSASKTLSPEHMCKIKELSGAAGHCLLTYPSGGQILTSSGHWIELARLDVSQEAVLRVVEARCGQAEATRMKTTWDSVSAGEREEMMQQCSRQYVQQSAPSRKGAWKSTT